MTVIRPSKCPYLERGRVPIFFKGVNPSELIFWNAVTLWLTRCTLGPAGASVPGGNTPSWKVRNR